MVDRFVFAQRQHDHQFDLAHFRFPVYRSREAGDTDAGVADPRRFGVRYRHAKTDASRHNLFALPDVFLQLHRPVGTSVDRQIAAQVLDHLLFTGEVIHEANIFQRQQWAGIFLRSEIRKQRFYFVRAATFTGFISQLAAGLAIKLAQQAFDRRNTRTAHAEFIQLHAEQQRQIARFATQFTADTDPFTVAMSHADNLAQHAQERRSNGIIQRRDARIIAIHGVEILGHIVGADAEEIHLIAEMVDDIADRRHLNHDPQRQRGGKA